MAKVTPVQRTKAYWKKHWPDVEIDNAQHWIPFGPTDPRRIKFKITGMRKDLFGIIDLIAIDTFSIIGIQVCGQDFAAHDRKILESNFSYKWLKINCIKCGCHGGAKLELWGWRQIINKDSPTKQKKWEPRIKKYALGDFE